MRFQKIYATISAIALFTLSHTSYAQPVVGSVMNEVFKKTQLASGVNDPWEITYGSDNHLWITVAKDYTIQRMDPATGAQTTVLNISPTGNGFLTPAEHTNYNRIAWTNPFGVPWPQGGLMGLALHPDFMHPTTPKKFVYVGYVRSQGSVPTNNTGQYYTNFLVRYTYNTGTGKLDSPVTLCDTLPGSKDHNSGRIIIAPVDGVNYLFYSSGDMGSGQYENLTRPIRSQIVGSYEGKVLRFNLEEDTDPAQNVGVRQVNYNRWIPSGAGSAGNPYNTYLGAQSAVWNMGHRNVQGLATAKLGGTDYLFAASHGPYSDDEINVLEAGKNYGHPLVIGYSNDGNYNQAKAGPSGGSLPFLTAAGELNNVANINALPFGSGYKDPLFSFYPVSQGSLITCSSPNEYHVQDIYRNCTGTGVNNFWKSEAVSGLGFYPGSAIPGWKNSFLMASLKWGRVLRVKLNDTYDGLKSVNGLVDTMPYFESRNRYRDMAISPDGKDIFVIMDESLSTSGPSQDNPTALNCLGCVVKYSFLGYNDSGGSSPISTSTPIAPGVSNALTNGTNTVINSDNNNIWVPITDSLGNIVAEIDANTNNLGTVTATLYKNSGAVRTSPTGVPYLDRSLTINVQNQPAVGTPVNVRLYLKAAELTSLIAAPTSGVTNINDLNIYKNSDIDGSAMIAYPENIVPSARASFGSDHVLKASISSFSTFYFASNATVVPVTLLSLNGKYANQSVYLQWKTENENNSSHFVVQRSTDGQTFAPLGKVGAAGNTTSSRYYSYNDKDFYSYVAPNVYYRLKMIDTDGTFKYSATINIPVLGLIETITVTPNPASNDLNANLFSTHAGSATWKIIDNAGRVIMAGNTNLSKGNNKLFVNIREVPAGSYYLHIQGAQIDKYSRFQKL